MDLALRPFIALAGGGLVCAVAAILWAFLRPAAPGNAVLAAVISAGFAGLTAITSQNRSRDGARSAARGAPTATASSRSIQCPLPSWMTTSCG